MNFMLPRVCSENTGLDSNYDVSQYLRRSLGPSLCRSVKKRMIPSSDSSDSSGGKFVSGTPSASSSSVLQTSNASFSSRRDRIAAAPPAPISLSATANETGTPNSQRGRQTYQKHPDAAIVTAFPVHLVTLACQALADHCLPARVVSALALVTSLGAARRTRLRLRFHYLVTRHVRQQTGVRILTAPFMLSDWSRGTKANPSRRAAAPTA